MNRLRVGALMAAVPLAFGMFVAGGGTAQATVITAHYVCATTSIVPLPPNFPLFGSSCTGSGSGVGSVTDTSTGKVYICVQVWGGSGGVIGYNCG
jgi:hypothetical protein